MDYGVEASPAVVLTAELGRSFVSGVFTKAASIWCAARALEASKMNERK
jgi:hypothetical protein